LIDLLVAVPSPVDATRVLDALDLDVAGVPYEFHREVEPRHSAVIVPRALFHTEGSRLVPPRREMRRSLVCCIPSSTSHARALAKIRGVFTVGLTVETLRMVDETQINFMSSSRERRFVEVLISDFLSLLAEERPRISVERAIEFACRAIDRALSLDVGIVVSSGARSIDRVLHPAQMDALLHSWGYTKRERRLLLEVYPLELVEAWRRWR